jgi:hypothetical protein
MVKDGNGRDIPNMEGCYFMNKKFLIPLVLVLLGVLIPVVYAATHGDETPEPPSSASVEPAVEEERAQDEVQENQHQEKEDVDAEDEEKEHQESAETAVSDKESSNTGSQSKQSTKGSQDNKSAETKQPTGQSTSSNQGKQGTSSSASQGSKQKDNNIQVAVTIVGKNGNIMCNSAKVDVKEKGTALDALYAAGLSCKVRSDGYVEEISGLAENSSGEGWMYSVNGGPPPPFGANKCTLNRGDRIIWFYGNIGDPPPKV